MSVALWCLGGLLALCGLSWLAGMLLHDPEDAACEEAYHRATSDLCERAVSVLAGREKR